MNVPILGFGVLCNAITRVLVPLRYLIMSFVVSIGLCVALWLYFNRRLVAVAISGRVDIANHWRLPVYD